MPMWGFSREAFEVFEHFNFAASIDLLEDADLLYKVVRNFANVDLPRNRRQLPHGSGVRGADPQICRKLQRDRREHFTPVISCG